MIKTIFLLPFINGQQCTPQNGPKACLALGPTAQCLLTSGGSNPEGYCWIPGTPTSRIIPGQTHANEGVFCGNSKNSIKCQLDQFCVNGTCTEFLESSKTFFTPLTIGLVIAGAIILFFGSFILCLCCKCCCFARHGSGIAAATLSRRKSVFICQQSCSTTMEGSKRILKEPDTDSTLNFIRSGTAPVVIDFNPSRKNGFQSEERNQIIPVQPLQPLSKSHNAPFSPYSNISSPENNTSVPNSYAVAYPNEDHQITKSDPMYPENRGLSLALHACQDFPEDYCEIGSIPVDWQSLKLATKTNRQLGTIVIKDKVPPSIQGFFGFWDSNCKFHQGYTDENLYIHGGVFDEHSYFHFGIVGNDSIFVDDSMMTYPRNIKESTPALVSDQRGILNISLAQETNFNIDELGKSPYLEAYQDGEEGGESMDGFACSIQNPRYI